MSVTRKDFRDIRVELRSAAASEAAQLRGEFERSFGPVKKISDISKSSITNKKLIGGEWDWWTKGKLSSQEKSRLRRKGYISSSGLSPDAYGLEKNADEFLDLTRRIDILERFAFTGKVSTGAGYRKYRH